MMTEIANSVLLNPLLLNGCMTIIKLLSKAINTLKAIGDSMETNHTTETVIHIQLNFHFRETNSISCLVPISNPIKVTRYTKAIMWEKMCVPKIIKMCKNENFYK